MTVLKGGDLLVDAVARRLARLGRHDPAAADRRRSPAARVGRRAPPPRRAVHSLRVVERRRTMARAAPGDAAGAAEQLAGAVRPRGSRSRRARHSGCRVRRRRRSRMAAARHQRLSGRRPIRRARPTFADALVDALGDERRVERRWARAPSASRGRCRSSRHLDRARRDLSQPVSRLMRILLVGDYARDARLGSTKVLVKLQEEFRALGHVCDLLLADDLGVAPRNAHLRRALAPIGAARRRPPCVPRQRPVRRRRRRQRRGLWIAAARRAGGFRRTAVDRALERPRTSRLPADARRSRPRAAEQTVVPPAAVSRGAVVAGRRRRTRGRPAAPVERNRSRVRAGPAAGSRTDRIDVVPHGISSAFLDDRCRRATHRAAAAFCSAAAGRR